MAVAQWETALDLGNQVRKRRKEERQRIAAMGRHEGRAALAGLIEDPPDWLVSAPLGRVLLWPRRMGRSTMVEMLRRAGGRFAAIGEFRAIGSLTALERARLVAALRERSR